MSSARSELLDDRERCAALWPHITPKDNAHHYWLESKMSLRRAFEFLSFSLRFRLSHLNKCYMRRLHLRRLSVLALK